MSHGFSARCPTWVKRADKTLAHIIPIIHLKSAGFPVVGIAGFGYSVSSYYYNMLFTDDYVHKMSGSKAHASIHIVGAVCAYLATPNMS
jgi:hypothetical protein